MLLAAAAAVAAAAHVCGALEAATCCGGEMAQLPLLLRAGARACSRTAAMASPSLIAAPS